MAPESKRQKLWSRRAEFAPAIRSNLQRRGSEKFARLPHPVQQAGRLIERTGRGTLNDRVPGLAAEAALFTLISLPALLLAIIGSLGFVAAALGPQGNQELRELVLGIPASFLSDLTYASYERTVNAVLTQTRGSVVSIGIVLSLWTGSRAVNRYLETITIAYNIEQRAGWRLSLIHI